jgi:hypothetical protein
MSASAAASPDVRSPSWAEVLTSPVLLTGLYVWGVSVAPTALVAAALGRGRAAPGAAPFLTIVASVGALACLGAGAFLERRRHPAAPFAGIWGFLGLAASGWLLTPAAVDVARLEALRGWLVSAGLVLYALAWGGPHPSKSSETDARVDPAAWAPRERLAPGAPLLLGLGIGSSMLIAFAWAAHEPTRSLAAHALAGLVGVGFVSAVARIAVERGRGAERSGRRGWLRRLAWAFAWLVLAVGGLVFAVLR